MLKVLKIKWVPLLLLPLLIIGSAFLIWFRISSISPAPIPLVENSAGISPQQRKLLSYNNSTNSYDFKCQITQIRTSSERILDNIYADIITTCDYKLGHRQSKTFLIPLRIRFNHPEISKASNTFHFYGSDYHNPNTKKTLEFTRQNLVKEGDEIRVVVTTDPATFNANYQSSDEELDKTIIEYYKKYPDLINQINSLNPVNNIILPKAIIYEPK